MAAKELHRMDFQGRIEPKNTGRQTFQVTVFFKVDSDGFAAVTSAGICQYAQRGALQLHLGGTTDFSNSSRVSKDTRDFCLRENIYYEKNRTAMAVSGRIKARAKPALTHASLKP